MAAAKRDRPAATAGNVGSVRVARSIVGWNVLGYAFMVDLLSIHSSRFTSSTRARQHVVAPAVTSGPGSPIAAHPYLARRARSRPRATHTFRARIGHAPHGSWKPMLWSRS